MWAMLMQAGESAGPMATLGVGGGIAALVITMWRQDRKESQDRYERLAKESQERYAVISADFRGIVEDNTKAITSLTERISHESSEGLTVRMLVEALRAGKPINIEPRTGSAGGGAD